jgi:hypothetical protein
MSQEREQADTDKARRAEKKGGTAPRGQTPAAGKPREIGGPEGPDPTRYGDWERDGRCIDF